jgi:Family of unknown function (DUF5985)
VSTEFLSGASMVAAVTIALYFLRYWLQSRNRLFLISSGARTAAVREAVEPAPPPPRRLPRRARGRTLLV